MDENHFINQNPNNFISMINHLEIDKRSHENHHIYSKTVNLIYKLIMYSKNENEYMKKSLDYKNFVTWIMIEVPVLFEGINITNYINPTFLFSMFDEFVDATNLVNETLTKTTFTDEQIPELMNAITIDSRNIHMCKELLKSDIEKKAILSAFKTKKTPNPIGLNVFVKYPSGTYYPGEIVKVDNESIKTRYSVNFDDGDEKNDIAEENIYVKDYSSFLNLIVQVNGQKIGIIIGYIPGTENNWLVSFMDGSKETCDSKHMSIVELALQFNNNKIKIDLEILPERIVEYNNVQCKIVGLNENLTVNLIHEESGSTTQALITDIYVYNSDYTETAKIYFELNSQFLEYVESTNNNKHFMNLDKYIDNNPRYDYYINQYGFYCLLCYIIDNIDKYYQDIDQIKKNAILQVWYISILTIAANFEITLKTFESLYFKDNKQYSTIDKTYKERILSLTNNNYIDYTNKLYEIIESEEISAKKIKVKTFMDWIHEFYYTIHYNETPDDNDKNDDEMISESISKTFVVNYESLLRYIFADGQYVHDGEDISSLSNKYELLSVRELKAEITKRKLIIEYGTEKSEIIRILENNDGNNILKIVQARAEGGPASVEEVFITATEIIKLRNGDDKEFTFVSPIELFFIIQSFVFSSKKFSDPEDPLYPYEMFRDKYKVWYSEEEPNINRDGKESYNPEQTKKNEEEYDKAKNEYDNYAQNSREAREEQQRQYEANARQYAENERQYAEYIRQYEEQQYEANAQQEHERYAREYEDYQRRYAEYKQQYEEQQREEEEKRKQQEKREYEKQQEKRRQYYKQYQGDPRRGRQGQQQEGDYDDEPQQNRQQNRGQQEQQNRQQNRGQREREQQEQEREREREREREEEERRKQQEKREREQEKQTPGEAPKNCTSFNKNPEPCKDKSHYKKQSMIFHPDMNFGCYEEADKKFKRLMSLPGCSSETESSNEEEMERLNNFKQDYEEETKKSWDSLNVSAKKRWANKYTGQQMFNGGKIRKTIKNKSRKGYKKNKKQTKHRKK